ncbi:hypothetical protein O1611_g175 [Lasiodiplodia mahajangana]|uniref:Uncharacterized protein n=1 Tax=Lasiodiplodia mahajangana TaxID=1108764 RepID=A0ACC2K144_9PEZI|nr:hypothetical protein O1611_g175 [Lasiodiplodia mahajangana]
MKIAEEETFGPLLALFPFETEEEAVRAANNTSMGLASYCFTKNVDRIWRLFENLEAGMIGLNTGNASAAESPFGGIKDSGYGKESGKDVAINEYLITKTGTLSLEGLQSMVSVKTTRAVSLPSARKIEENVWHAKVKELLFMEVLRLMEERGGQH